MCLLYPNHKYCTHIYDLQTRPSQLVRAASLLECFMCQVSILKMQTLLRSQLLCFNHHTLFPNHNWKLRIRKVSARQNQNITNRSSSVVCVSFQTLESQLSQEKIETDQLQRQTLEGQELRERELVELRRVQKTHVERSSKLEEEVCLLTKPIIGNTNNETYRILYSLDSVLVIGILVLVRICTRTLD